ncbi:hypothetical protein, partial [Actinoplanes sp. NPDC049316]|uniref:hypothetical protein n=1 Tax=Actinoplanes sp. NPDC049316 TaxID=3154727 RepID=UPI00343205A5
DTMRDYMKGKPKVQFKKPGDRKISVGDQRSIPRRGTARQGAARPGTARRGTAARHGTARLSAARRG